MKWRIWYGDGSNFSHLDGEPSEAPAWGVQVIVQSDDQSGRFNQCMDDFYTWLGDRWRGVDFVGLLDYLAHHGAPCVVRFGRTVPNAQFKAVLQMAEADPDMPARSGWHKGEFRP